MDFAILVGRKFGGILKATQHFVKLIYLFPSATKTETNRSTIFSRLNTGGVYLERDLVDPAFTRGPVLI